jgi:predicted XRE-type DNA-binding protein
MTTLSPDIATIQALRSDLALQLGRHVRRMAATQVAAAKQLRLPQPTLSKIVNGRVADLSLELLVRVAVRAGLPMTLLTGRVPQEAGAFRSGMPWDATRPFPSKLGDAARRSLIQSEPPLTPSQRLEAFLEHNQLLGALHQAGQAAEARRLRLAPCET